MAAKSMMQVQKMALKDKAARSDARFGAAMRPPGYADGGMPDQTSGYPVPAVPETPHHVLTQDQSNQTQQLFRSGQFMAMASGANAGPQIAVEGFQGSGLGYADGGAVPLKAPVQPGGYAAEAVHLARFGFADGGAVPGVYSVAPTRYGMLAPQPFHLADGGMVGNAADAIRNRHNKLDDAEMAMVKGTPAPAEPATAPTAPTPAPAAPVKKGLFGLGVLGLADGGEALASHYARGGMVRGPGTATSDSIPARLSTGEYVLPADTVAAIGKDKLDAVKDATHVPVAAKFGTGYANGDFITGSDGVTRVDGARSGYGVEELPAENVDYSQTPNPSMRTANSPGSNFNVRPGAQSREAVAYNARFGAAAPPAAATTGAPAEVAAAAAPASAPAAADGVAAVNTAGRAYRAGAAAASAAKATGSVLGNVARVGAPLVAGGLAAADMAQNGANAGNVGQAIGAGLLAVPNPYAKVAGAALTFGSPLVQRGWDALKAQGATNADGTPHLPPVGEAPVTPDSANAAALAASVAAPNTSNPTGGHFSDARWDSQHSGGYPTSTPAETQAVSDKAAGITPAQRDFFNKAGVDSTWTNKGDFGGNGQTIYRKGNSYVGAGGGTNAATGYAPAGVDFGFAPGEVQAYKDQQAQNAAGFGIGSVPERYVSPETTALTSQLQDMIAKAPKSGDLGFNRSQREIEAKQSQLAAFNTLDQQRTAHDLAGFNAKLQLWTTRRQLANQTIGYGVQHESNQLNYDIQRARLGSEVEQKSWDRNQQNRTSTEAMLRNSAKAELGDTPEGKALGDQMWDLATQKKYQIKGAPEGTTKYMWEVDPQQRADVMGDIRKDAFANQLARQGGLPASPQGTNQIEPASALGTAKSWITSPKQSYLHGAVQVQGGNFLTAGPNVLPTTTAYAAEQRQKNKFGTPAGMKPQP